MAVRELEMRLKGASEEELSELARQELKSVLKQLKEQEDILRKQEFFSKTIKIHDERLNVQFQKSQQIDEQLQSQAEASKRLKEQLDAQAELDKLHDQELKIQSETDKMLERELQAQEKKLNMLKDEMLNLKIMLDSKANNTLLKITLVFSIIAFIMSIIHFFFYKG